MQSEHAVNTNVIEVLQRNPALLHKARLLQLIFDVFVDTQCHRVSIGQGTVSMAPHPAGAPDGWAAFTIRASQPVWDAFASPERRPQYHDLIAMVESGHATVSGDLLPFFRNLFVVKGVLAAAFRGDASW
ncbi:MAG: hypothetical protein JWP52_1188 [Rhizobacter sp.]|nr:hypothetical protein [Rhizobacter sp.]